MKKWLILTLLFVSGISLGGFVQAEAEPELIYTDEDYQRLHTVIQHVENVLR